MLAACVTLGLVAGSVVTAIALHHALDMARHRVAEEQKRADRWRAIAQDLREIADTHSARAYRDRRRAEELERFYNGSNMVSFS